ncbi:TetR family transcriptional regulator C-terminal domain-containing protein [Streptomyces sp. E11-3]|uniref:TetR/AcrR family transcriptional regulator n=1 Tax=Streptomyces sp. E11-3 TaxID=3110112 RepID=UPI00397F8F89
MPKYVDHAERRAQIADGVVRLAARDGLHAVTLRAVAAESGVSLRLVQYYFESKAQLMRATLEHLELQSHQRWEQRLAHSSRPASTRLLLEAFLAEALPNDEPSRAFHLVWTSYAVLAMTDPELAQQSFVDGPARLEQRLTDVIRQAQAQGELDPGLDAHAEAARLLALNHGLGTSVMVGQRTAEQAGEVLRYHLDGLFAAHPTGEQAAAAPNARSLSPS